MEAGLVAMIIAMAFWLFFWPALCVIGWLSYAVRHSKLKDRYAIRGISEKSPEFKAESKELHKESMTLARYALWIAIACTAFAFYSKVS